MHIMISVILVMLFELHLQLLNKHKIKACVINSVFCGNVTNLKVAAFEYVEMQGIVDVVC